ncbi:ATG3/ATG10 family protein [Aspergillus tanneri]|uniref:Ubiquitin-like-conjugating enzyme ATG10 n=1 Tax=Aspergillus tanneri TaxID=1220188 RepID=A0A5M9N1U6_9EURO|nr:uncharacterized protein ATNIH1004_001170 [Aspergillus tanneri]KAA8652266.1 hypothetical protein ATNIH1004_001170 [Aspergillus tanneri]
MALPFLLDTSTSAFASASSLSVCPFLTREEFECACRAFLDRVHLLGLSAVGWSSIQLVHQVVVSLLSIYVFPAAVGQMEIPATGPILKLSRSIDNVDIHQYNATPAVDTTEPRLEASEDDPEALVRTSRPSTCLLVEYEILLSPTYQVPVLYFMLRGSNLGPLGVDAVYHYLVADQHKKELQSVGVMGGISFGYHPLSETPTFFVHPCNTADAMRQIVGQQNITPEKYLIAWLGLIGNHLGLHLPKELLKLESKEQGNPKT